MSADSGSSGSSGSSSTSLAFGFFYIGGTTFQGSFGVFVKSPT
jgi:hypothetical protein